MSEAVNDAQISDPQAPATQCFDVAIAGAGIIGLSLALELRQRGHSVVVLEQGHAMRGASWAAGGMLAAMDPENPLALQTLSLHSIALYPEYLANIQQLSGERVPLRTRRTLQQISAEENFMGKLATFPAATFSEIRQLIPGIATSIESTPEQKFFWLEEDSLDPRDLCRALPKAAQAAGVTILEQTTVLGVHHTGDSVIISTNHDDLRARMFVNCCGAWAAALYMDQTPIPPLPIAPAKGQMVTVALPAERLRCVLRIPGLYLIPRGDGRVTIGATIENVGFDNSVQQKSIQGLIDTAATLVPELQQAAQLDSWAGFRPATPDGLPILGPAAPLLNPAQIPRCWLATGHFRNGIMLAPVTARCMAQAMLGERTDVPLDSFAASRFAAAEAHFTPS